MAVPSMPLELSWQQVALRLSLACVSGMMLGYNRDEHGRPAGMRTVMLVMLTATLAMLQVNAMLSLSGKTPSGFNTLDLMRLPLGILSGIGFIGAGAIIKKQEGTVGVTTAATLWYTTMLGLLFGGGQIMLGIIGTVLGLGTLILLRRVEQNILRERHGELTLLLTEGAPTEAEIRARIVVQPSDIQSWNVRYEGEQLVSVGCTLQWRANAIQAPHTPANIAALRSLPGVIGFHWEQ